MALQDHDPNINWHYYTAWCDCLRAKSMIENALVEMCKHKEQDSKGDTDILFYLAEVENIISSIPITVHTNAL